MFQVVIEVVHDLGCGHHVQFLARRDMLDDARNTSHSHFAKRIRAVAAVVEDQAVFRVDGVHEIGTEPDGKSDDSREVSRRRVILDVVGLQFHGSEETHVVGRRHKDELVPMHARPFHGRLRVVVQETGPENLFFAR